MIGQLSTQAIAPLPPHGLARDQLCILVVEDSIVFREILKAALGGKHLVYVAASVKEGWKVFKEKSPHIVFMDIHLQKSSGHELVQMIKKENPATYIVMATGSRSIADKLTAAYNHADGFLVKPFQMKDINACVERYQAARHAKPRV